MGSLSSLGLLLGLYVGPAVGRAGIGDSHAGTVSTRRMAAAVASLVVAQVTAYRQASKVTQLTILVGFPARGCQLRRLADTFLGVQITLWSRYEDISACRSTVSLVLLPQRQAW